MRTRQQTIEDLIEASDFKDSEIVLNIEFIRDLFNDAVGQLKDVTKIIADNKRHRAHIKQLKAANTNLLTKVEQLTSKCHQLERERDAAVEDMTNIVMKYGESYCEYCKGKDTHNCAGRCWIFNEGFEWRGVKEE